jgi:hypothetical protein
LPPKPPRTGAALAQTPQRLAFVQGDMGGLFAFDLILRLIFVCVMDVAFVIQIFGVDAHDFAADSTSFRIPTHAIANFEPWGHSKPLRIEDNA